MCIDAVKPVPEKNVKGYAYKVVCNTRNPDEFKGKWLKFNRNGGGVQTSSNKNICRNCVTWKVNRLYRVKHNRMVHAFDTGEQYKAGVHLYKDLIWAEKKQGYGDVILVCYFTSAFAQDGKTIVANRVTPLLVLRSTADVTSFNMMRKHYGIKTAIKRYLEYQDKN